MVWRVFLIVVQRPAKLEEVRAAIADGVVSREIRDQLATMPRIFLGEVNPVEPEKPMGRVIASTVVIKALEIIGPRLRFMTADMADGLLRVLAGHNFSELGVAQDLWRIKHWLNVHLGQVCLAVRWDVELGPDAEVLYGQHYAPGSMG